MAPKWTIPVLVAVLTTLPNGVAAAPAPEVAGPQLRFEPAVRFRLLDPDTRLRAPPKLPDGSTAPMATMPRLITILGGRRWGELGVSGLTRSTAPDCSTADAACTPESTAAILIDLNLRASPVTIYFGPTLSSLALTRPGSARADGPRTAVSTGFMFGIQF